jgi:hypothetical protein
VKLKLDDAGHVVLQDGKPVYVTDDGKDVAYDAPAMHSKITALNAEAQKRREEGEALKEKLKAFEGIEDAEAARKALETIKNFDDKKLIDAGEVDKIKAAAKAAAEEQAAAAAKAHAAELGKLKSQYDALQSMYHGEKIGSAFAGSKFVTEKMRIPGDMVQAKFGGAFKVEDGKLIAYDQSGNKIYSRVKPGEVADFDEALESLVDSYPHKDDILKGIGSTGSETQHGRKQGDGKKTPGNFGGSREERAKAIAARFPDLAKQ